MSPLKLLLLVVLIFITYKLFTGRAAVKQKESEVKDKKDDESVELVQDPVSGLYIDKDTTYKVKYYDQIYYFASQENMDKFVSDKKGDNQ